MKIASIHIYPIKSLAGISLQSPKVVEQGLIYDRRWVLVNRRGLFQSQRTMPQLALFLVQIRNNGLVAIAPNGSEINIPFNPEGAQREVTIWDDEVTGVEVSTHINSWFSAQLGKDVYLVCMTPNTQRFIDDRYAINSETVSFADGYPVLIASMASLHNLNSRLEQPIEIERFRANIVIIPYWH